MTIHSLSNKINSYFDPTKNVVSQKIKIIQRNPVDIAVEGSGSRSLELIDAMAIDYDTVLGWIASGNIKALQTHRAAASQFGARVINMAADEGKWWLVEALFLLGYPTNQRTHYLAAKDQQFRLVWDIAKTTGKIPAKALSVLCSCIWLINGLIDDPSIEVEPYPGLYNFLVFKPEAADLVIKMIQLGWPINDLKSCNLSEKTPVEVLDLLWEKGMPSSEELLSCYAVHGCLDRVEEVFRKGNVSGERAILECARAGKFDSVTRLIELGASKNIDLSSLLLDRNYEMLDFLISKGAKFKGRESYYIFLMSAAPEDIEFLIEKYPDAFKYRALEHCVCNGNRELYNKLIDMNACPEPYCLPIDRGYKSLELFEEYCQQVKVLKGYCFDHLGCLGSSDESCLQLLQIAEPYFERGVSLDGALNTALYRGRKNTIEWLLEKGAKLPDKAVYECLSRGKYDLASWLIEEKRVDPKITMYDVCNVNEPKFTRQYFHNVWLSQYGEEVQETAKAVLSFFSSNRKLLKNIEGFNPARAIFGVEDNSLSYQDEIRCIHAIHERRRFQGGNLEQIIFEEMGLNEKLWENIYPHFDCPLDLSSLSPVNFSLDVYEEIIDEIKEAAETEGVLEYQLMAYKLAVLFDDSSSVREYLESCQKWFPGSTKPVHDACLFPLPNKGKWDVTAWRNWAQSNDWNPKMMNVFSYAPEIEVTISQGLPSMLEIKGSFEAPDGKDPQRAWERYAMSYLGKSSFRNAERLLANDDNIVSLWEALEKLQPLDARSFISRLAKKTIEARKSELVAQCADEMGISIAEMSTKKALSVLLKTNQEQFNAFIDNVVNESIENPSFRWGPLDDKLSPINRFKMLAQRLEEVKVAETVKGNSLSVKEWGGHLFMQRELSRLTYTNVIRLIIEGSYKNIPEKYFDFAFECVKVGLSKKDFDLCLKILNEQKKEVEYLPEVTLQGRDFCLEDFTFSKMKANDPMQFILGKKTGCCQSINGASKDVVIHGATHPASGFYSLKSRSNKNPWIAQSWAGFTQDGELLFDSIEWSKGHDADQIMKFYQIAATKILMEHPEIPVVLFGGGGNTPKRHRFSLQGCSEEGYSRMIGYRNIGYDSVDTRYILAKQGELDPEIVSMLHEQGVEEQSSSQHWEPVTGRDAYVNPGRQVKGARMDFLHRAKFFRDHPNVDHLLKEPKNPLMEEGMYADEDKRGYFGERYLSFEVLKTTMELKVKGREGVDHFILVNDSPRELQEKLSEMHLDEGEMALVGYVDGIHSTGAMISVQDGQERIVYFDPEDTNATESSLGRILQVRFPEATKWECGVKLQKDFSSCGVFLVKAFQYFAKHGREFAASFEGSDSSWNRIPIEAMPAELLKMGQYSFEGITEEQNSTVVSRKKGMTLAEYLEANAADWNETVNLAAIKVKYRLLDKVESHLARLSMA